MTINKSPATPPRGGTFPLPDIDNCISLETPAGILIGMISSSNTRPSPKHASHLAPTLLPSPLQVGQVDEVTIWPNIVFWTRFTWPDPWHVPQVFKSVPFFEPFPEQDLQATWRFTLIFFSTPFAISSKFNFNLIRKSVPLRWRLPPPRPPLKKLPNGLSSPPPPKISPNWENISSMFMPWPPNPPPAAPPIPACPKRSYCDFFWALLNTS